MNRIHCIPGLTMSPALMRTSLRECPGIIKTMHTEFWHIFLHVHCLYQRPGADTEETGRYDLAWKDLCSVLNALK